MGSYQTFAGRPGASKSEQKLQRLQLPTRLKGKRVLDLGCNEGFFSIEAKRRGASYVLGIDRSAKFIEAARRHAEEVGGGIEFRQGDMLSLPEDKFDYVLLLSALHYIDDPVTLFRHIRSRLKSDGFLILECGVAGGAERTIQRVLRSIDARLFPTLPLLREVWLRDYAVRAIGRSIDQDGDPIPRSVFRCSPRKANIIFVVGPGRAGKTTLASQIKDAVIISTDKLFSPVRQPRTHFLPEIQERYDNARAHEPGLSIRRGWAAVKDDPEARKYFSATIVEAIRACGDYPLIVVEGYILTDIVADVEALLGGSYYFWRAGPTSADAPEAAALK